MKKQINGALRQNERPDDCPSSDPKNLAYVDASQDTDNFQNSNDKIARLPVKVAARVMAPQRRAALGYHKLYAADALDLTAGRPSREQLVILGLIAIQFATERPVRSIADLAFRLDLPSRWTREAVSKLTADGLVSIGPDGSISLLFAAEQVDLDIMSRAAMREGAERGGAVNRARIQQSRGYSKGGEDGPF